MARSRRKNPIIGIVKARTERYDKRRWHKSLRTKAKASLLKVTDPFLPLAIEVSDIWGFAKDGKRLLDLPSETQFLRK